MTLLDDLQAVLTDRAVLDVRIGLHWTAVVVDGDSGRRCGLASTLVKTHEHTGKPDVPQAGALHTLSGLELARLAASDQPTLASVGVAAINALVPTLPEAWVDVNAEEVIATHGAGKTVALIGSFPFIPRLRARVGNLIVLERNPQSGELPAGAAPDVLPGADVVAITGTTLINHTLEGLLKLCAPGATVLVLGPSTPLSPVLFEHSVDLLSGAVVTAVEPVLQAVCQGAHFPQVHRAGVRLVNMTRPGYPE
ncbi:MAG: DUF364 domain-containing protein [Anaerolineae bacterium]|nr:DUF364 domain-containing protein [Anaerolineae bacterium]